MELGRRGEADLLILHDPAGEEAFVADGFGIERAPLMHNEFVLVGPAADPARAKAQASAAGALAAIARAGVRFVSRGDRSGTHVKELALWRRAGVAPRGAWYLESGQGMGPTLQIANELLAYTLTDVGTFLGHRYPLDLEIVLEGDTALFNPYHVVLVNSARFGWVDVGGARELKDFLLAPETQVAIADFRRAEFGRSLFLPDAVGEARAPR